MAWKIVIHKFSRSKQSAVRKQTKLFAPLQPRESPHTLSLVLPLAIRPSSITFVYCFISISFIAGATSGLGGHKGVREGVSKIRQATIATTT